MKANENTLFIMAIITLLEYTETLSQLVRRARKREGTSDSVLNRAVGVLTFGLFGLFWSLRS